MHERNMEAVKRLKKEIEISCNPTKEEKPVLIFGPLPYALLKNKAIFAIRNPAAKY